jgi:hypothetical protein
MSQKDDSKEKSDSIYKKIHMAHVVTADSAVVID